MPTIVALAPNGGRLTKKDHPKLPLTLEELASEAHTCSKLGASIMHFHVRDQHGSHSLDAGIYREALREISPAAAGKIILQISTEAGGIGIGNGRALYTPSEQANCILNSGCSAASIAFAEIARAEKAFVKNFYAQVTERKIHIQHIIYSPAEATELQRASTQGIRLGAHKLCLLFVFNRKQQAVQSQENFTSFINACKKPFADEPSLLYFICAFGKHEQARLLQAAGKIHNAHIRLGFENNIYRPNGKTANSNAEQVAEFVRSAKENGIAIASYKETRAQLGLDAE